MIEDGNMANASTGSMVVLTMDVILLVTCAIIHVTATFLYKYEVVNFARQYVYEERTGSMNNRRRNILFDKSFLSIHRNDSFESPEEVQNVYVPVVYFTVNSLIVVGGCFVLYYVHIYFKTKHNFWMLIALFFGNQGLVIPTIMIYKYASFRTYLERQFLPIKDVISSFGISTRVCRRRRDTRVHNLDDETLP